ncbi:MAG TPA: DNA translocase FtsK 4TM domain-containing protein, partial [Sphingomonas sp.]|nr:DNA translocase FtsK 4TM domain-containing protein [Sphingomonas sp.]
MASRVQPMLWRDTMKAGAKRSGALIGAIALFVLTFAAVLAIGTYSGGDPSLNTAAGGPAKNLLGAPGAWLADLLLAIGGLPVVLLAPVGLIVATRLWKGNPVGAWGRMLGGAALGIALMGTAFAFVSSRPALEWELPGSWGGIVGLSVANLLRWGLNLAGEPMVTLWGGRALGLIAGIAGVVVWARSVQLEVSQLRLPRRDRSGAETGEVDEDFDDTADLFTPAA